MISEVKHSDIITGRGHMKHVNQIVDNFIDKQKDRGLTITDKHKRELNKVTKILVAENKINKPIVINAGLGFGKSTLLVEYIKYMCEIDKEFGALIVKKTIRECKDLVMDIGVKEEYKMAFSGTPIEEELRNNYKQDEDRFIALAIRGFNKEDCIKDNIGLNVEQEQEYSPSLCATCEEKHCSIKTSQWNVKKHRIVVATHRRLFLSNDNDEILSRLLDWMDENGNIHKRRLVIVDEKLDTIDIGSVKLKSWVELSSKLLKSPLEMGLKEEINNISKYLNELDYPLTSQGIVKVPHYDKSFKFPEIVFGLFKDNSKGIGTLNSVEKFLRYGGTISRDWRDDLQIISYYNYLRVDKYFKDNFSKCIVLDATCKLDSDYLKSEVVHVSDLKPVNIPEINVLHTKGVNISKGNLYFNGNKNSTYQDNLDYYNENIRNIVKDIRDIINHVKSDTLIVCFKEIKDKLNYMYSFKDDLIASLLSLEIPYKYHVVHFGQCTTGINDYNSCKNIIFIGQLSKGTLYYSNKAFCLGGVNPNEVKINEYTIDTIQQIGRTALRQGESVNVYMMGQYDDLINNLGDYFNTSVSIWTTKYFNYFSIKGEKDISKVHARKFIMDNLGTIGDSIKKKAIKSYLVKLGNSEDTAEKAIQDFVLLDNLKGQGIIQNPQNNREFIKEQ